MLYLSDLKACVMNREFNIDSIVRSNIKKLNPYSSARDEFTDFDREMVFLDANENPFENGVNRYPDPQQRKLKTILADRNEVNVNQVLLGNGSDEVLDLIFRAFCEPNRDNVITLPPTYGMYNVLANVNAVENKEVMLKEKFQPNLQGIRAAIDANSKILFICSPNNPTGNCFREDNIVSLLNGFPGLVVIDEAYIDFTKKESWVSRLKEYPNLMVTQTLSKAYGMAGIRLGICFASEEIVAVLNKIKPPYNVNTITQERAIERLQNPSKVNSEINCIIEQRGLLIKSLLEVTFVLEIFPSEANFVLVKVDDANKRYDQLIRAGIVVRNRSNQPLCENTLRFTIGSKAENEQLIKTLKSIAI